MVKFYRQPKRLFLHSTFLLDERDKGPVNMLLLDLYEQLGLSRH